MKRIQPKNMSKIVDAIVVQERVRVKGVDESTDPSNGSVIVDGGVGVQKNLYVGGNIVVGGRISGGSRTISADTILDEDHVVSVTATATITLPNAATSVYAGMEVASCPPFPSQRNQGNI